MKRILFSLLLAAAGISASAMNARDAREYAYFLTDKMADELATKSIVTTIYVIFFQSVSIGTISTLTTSIALFLGEAVLGFLISIIVIAIAITITLVDHPVMIVTKVPIGHCD